MPLNIPAITQLLQQVTSPLTILACLTNTEGKLIAYSLTRQEEQVKTIGALAAGLWRDGISENTNTNNNNNNTTPTPTTPTTPTPHSTLRIESNHQKKVTAVCELGILHISHLLPSFLLVLLGDHQIQPDTLKSKARLLEDRLRQPLSQI